MKDKVSALYFVVCHPNLIAAKLLSKSWNYSFWFLINLYVIRYQPIIYGLDLYEAGRRHHRHHHRHHH